MIAEFLIFLREGLEGSMIISILLASLRQIGQPERVREVWWGVTAALVVALGGGVLAYQALHAYSGTPLQTALEGSTYLVAAAALTYMTFWMRQESTHLRGDLSAQTSRAVASHSRWAITSLAFVTVAREGLETVVFSLAIALAAQAWQVMVGAVIGLVVALVISRAIYRMGLKVNLGRFFAVMGSLLMVTGAGLLADAIEDYQQLGWLPGAHAGLWSTSQWLPEQSFWGDLAHTFVGYAAAPTFLQLAVWAAYLAIVLSFWLSRRPRLVGSA
ncbi:MAG: FTR1 family iron permease [Sulfobacillus sp.]